MNKEEEKNTIETCPKCGFDSGDDWVQCQGFCPIPISPHYKGHLGMLIVTRTLQDHQNSIIIGDQFVVKLIDIRGKQARIGVAELSGKKEYKINRLEKTKWFKWLFPMLKKGRTKATESFLEGEKDNVDDHNY